MNIDNYFASLERGLRQNPLVSHLQQPFVCLASDDLNGLVRGRVFFWDDSFLDIYETVSTELGYPVRIGYAYTYLHNRKRVFRYDNAPHHPEIVTFPHHKHIGPEERLAPSDQPSRSQVLVEISFWLENNSAK
ncbi:MAG: DUF6516 family protein [Caldilineaceae bacterium]